MSKIEVIVAGDFRLEYIVEQKEQHGANMGFPTHHVWLEAQCIIEFKDGSMKPPPVTFLVKTRELRPFEFSSDFAVNLFTGRKSGLVPENNRHHVLAVIWGHLHSGIPRLPIPLIDLNKVDIIG